MQLFIILTYFFSHFLCNYIPINSSFNTNTFESNDNWEISENITNSIQTCSLSYFGASLTNGKQVYI